MRKGHRFSVFAAVTAAGLVLATAGLGGPPPPSHDIGVGDDYFQPDPFDMQIQWAGGQINFDWVSPPTAHLHNVRQDRRLFYSGTATRNGSYSFLASAGRFHYYCERHGSPAGGMDGFLKVRPSSEVSIDRESIEVVWGGDVGDRFDVRYRIGREGEWRNWRHDTAKKSGVFGRNDRPVDVGQNKTYYFQARSKRAANPKAVSLWSSYAVNEP